MAAGAMLLLARTWAAHPCLPDCGSFVVAPFQYSQIICGCVYGALMFAAPIEVHTLAGAGVIMVSGWLVLR